jgi:hypothetical protein
VIQLADFLPGTFSAKAPPQAEGYMVTVLQNPCQNRHGS